MNRRGALLRLAYVVVAPILFGIYFFFWRRDLERESQLMARIPSAIREGKVKPTYATADLNWKPASGVYNQVELDPSGQIHVVTDSSTFSYQVVSDAATGGAEFCYVAFSVDVIKGGASVMVLDQKGNSLASKNLDRTWKYHEQMMVRSGNNKTLNFVVANDFPGRGQSEFRILQFDVYCIPSGTNI